MAALEIVTQASFLIAAVLLIQKAFGDRLHVYVRYALWLPVVLRLVLPFHVAESPVGVAQALHSVQERLTWYNAQAAQGRDENAAGGFAAGIDAEFSGSDFTDVIGGIAGGRAGRTDMPEGAADRTARGAAGQRLPIAVILTVLWLVGALAAGGFLLGAKFRFVRRLRRTRTLYTGPLESAESIAPLPVYRVKNLASPCLVGTFRPAVYVGEDLDVRSDCFRYAVLHEKVHWLHRDHLWALLRGLLVAVYWFHPLVWLAAARSVRDGELACDYGTVRRLGRQEGPAYGEMLLALAGNMEGKRIYPYGTLLRPGRSELKRRIQLVTKENNSRIWAGALAAVVMLAAAGCAFTGAETTQADTAPVADETSVETGADTAPVADETVGKTGAAAVPLADKAAGETEAPQETDALQAAEDAIRRAEEELQQQKTAEAEEVQQAVTQIAAVEEELQQRAAELEALLSELPEGSGQEAVRQELDQIGTAADELHREREALETLLATLQAEPEIVESAASDADDIFPMDPFEDSAVDSYGILFETPCANARISDTFGEKTNPDTGETIRHDGIDFAAPEGTDVTAGHDGTVYAVGFSAVYGNYVVLAHSNGQATYYCHCREITVGEGDEVKRGQKIATVGATGQATGPVLHFMVSERGEFEDPALYLEQL